MKTLNIVIFDPTPSGSKGGAELSTFSLSKELSLLGNTLFLVYSSYGSLVPQYSNFCKHATAIKQAELDKRQPIRSILLFIFSLIFLFLFYKKNKIRIDYVYTHSMNHSLFCGIFAKIYGAKLIIHPRVPPAAKPTIQKKLGFFFAKNTIVPSKSMQELWYPYIRSKPTVVYNGLDPAIYLPSAEALKAEKTILSYIGRIHPTKGIEVLIEAFISCLNYRKDIVLNIVGSPYNEDKDYFVFLKKIAQAAGDNIAFLPHTENILNQYQKSSLTILPSLWPEPFGRTIVESMLCEVPAIASRVGGIPEIFKSFPNSELFLTDPNDPQMLLDKILFLIDWREKFPRLGKELRQYAKSNFSIKQKALTIHELLCSSNFS